MESIRAAQLARSVFCTALVLALATTLSSAANKPAATEAAYPAGSTTYFVTFSIWSPDALDVSAPIPATLKSTRQIQRLFNRLERAASSPSAEKPNQEAEDDEPHQAQPLSVQIWQYTITVWSNGQLEHSPMTQVTARSLQQIIVRLEAAEEEFETLKNHPTPAPATAVNPATGKSASQGNKQAETATYPAGERCHAKCDSGQRCSRAAKGTSGFCWQHAENFDAFPNR
jgi:hypothetical protein